MSESFTYRVDPNDILVSVSDNWEDFAADNSGAASSAPESVVGRPLETFIEDDETRSLYALVLDSVRRKRRPMAFEFRCDAPAERRFCELRIKPCDDGSVDFESRILRTEAREHVPLPKVDDQRNDGQFLKACSLCKRVEVKRAAWVEIEQAMQDLELNRRERAPRITHGLCADCHERILASI